MTAKNTDKEPMKLFITITGGSAEELFAVGPNDLKDYFLPKGLNVKPEDVARIHFEQVTERKPNHLLPSEYIVHKDNYSREKALATKKREER